ncbi:MAG: CAP domain-containing protein [Treponema sp.]|nr:CAP domain-containing protein [Treponema sp.]
MKKALVLFTLAAAILFACAAFASCRSAPEYTPAPCYEPACAPNPLPPYEVHEFELRVFELTNLQRSNHRLPPLIWHEQAAFAARGHSVDMEYNDFMRHTGSDGSNPRQRLECVGIDNIGNLGANIAGGWLTPEDVVAAWMDSPRYRPNILRREFTHVGIGFFQRPEGSNSRFAAYWTQKFFLFE